MKKLFCYLSVVALMVMATGCKNDKSSPVTNPDNDGEENVLYGYHTILQSLCGGTIFNANNQLLNNGFTQVTTGNYRIFADNYMINVTFYDTNSDELIEMMDITVEPSEVKHDDFLTFDYIKEFVQLMEEHVKLFSNYYYCDFCGFYTADGNWMALNDYDGLFSEVNAENMDGGRFYWVDENYTDFTENIQANPQYTGMYLQSDFADGSQGKSETEYSVHINYVVNYDI